MLLLLLLHLVLGDCNLENGEVILEGMELHLFPYDVAPKGKECIGQDIKCVKGKVIGPKENIYNNCTTDPMCDGGVFGPIKPYQTVTAYKSDQQPCYSEIRMCVKGRLTGSYTERSCEDVELRRNELELQNNLREFEKHQKEKQESQEGLQVP